MIMGKGKMEEESKVMRTVTRRNIRGIVERANELGIAKNDVISLCEDGDFWILVYYK